MSAELIHMPHRRIPQWTFAERVRKARRDLGIRQNDFAERLGVSLSAYSAWETGRNTPDIAKVAPRLEAATGIPRTWFLGWEDESPHPDGPGGGMDVHPLGLEPRTHWIRDNVRHVDFGSAAA